MTTLASSLLDFILDLFRDPDAAAAYEQDPAAALSDAGLGDVDPADVAALMPMVAADHAPAYGGDHCGPDDKGDDKGAGHHHPKPVQDADCDDDKGAGHHPKPVEHDHDKDDDHGGKPHTDWNGHGHEAAVIHNVSYVENSYSYSHTDVDVDIDASHSIWAGGDVYAIWGDENVIATGGSVAAGDDVEDVSVDNSDNSVTDVDVEIEDSFNEDNSTTTTTTTTIADSNVAVAGGEVEDNDTTVDTDIEVEDSFNGSTVAGGDVDQSTTTDVEVEDSFNGNTLAGGNVDQSTTTTVDTDIEDSFNETENTVEVEDSFNTETSVEDSFNTETEVEVDDSFKETDTDIDDSFNDVEIEDNTVLVDDGAPV
jgi:hypothetical protein